MKIEIRKIHDVNDNVYKIYDLMRFDKRIGRYRSICVYESLEDALKWNPGAEVIDKSRE